ncbi:hypothetical protein A606_00255 [Corynebacterium terpenotabidum Y-11]|uniref:Uncharacterized protein n=1 Tax=Corynebacterium terpenotabidum Y-11 TaxID=1200352 RepID=S4XB68_9CORY|nr:hypothetical protein A606_00255 [Corynebacterium terpenotabidum Y-11]
MPSRSSVTPQVPRSSKRGTAVAAPNWRDAQEPRMQSTGSVIPVAEVRAEVLTGLLCSSADCPVQLKY